MGFDKFPSRCDAITFSYRLRLNEVLVLYWEQVVELWLYQEAEPLVVQLVSVKLEQL
ncbi:MAG: hypothetical protein AB4426_29280 [Xenococcaceae cyanobacterium]